MTGPPAGLAMRRVTRAPIPAHWTACYRPISLLPTLYRVYAVLLKQWLMTALNAALPDMQFGFRPAKARRSFFWCVRRVFNYLQRSGARWNVVFLGWAKAFDSVRHRVIADTRRRTR